MDRRSFLAAGLAAPAYWMTATAAPAPSAFSSRNIPAHELGADLVIIGGGLGGCAAALAAARNGLRVILTEETDWIGGQLTQQAVPMDEHGWIESFGAPASYRELRRRIRDYYRRNYPLTAEATRNPVLNPGNGWVSRIACEPRVGLAALYEMLMPHLSARKITLLLEHVPVAAETDGSQVKAIQVQDLQTGHFRVLRAPYFLDATETGELLPLTGTEYVTGFESRDQTGEPMAPEKAQPQNMQAITWCFAIDYVPGEDHTIDPPEDYAFWREYVPALTPPWPGKLLAFAYSHPQKPGESREGLGFDPIAENKGGRMGFWSYRRIIHTHNFVPGANASDITVVNWPQNDYLPGSIIDVPREEKEKHLRGARQLSLSLLYWLQTEAPRAGGGTGWPGLRLRPDITGTPDGLAKYPYIRESRRILAEFTITARHVWAQARMQEMGTKYEDTTAAPFADSVGVGSYRIDLHPSTGGDNYVDLDTCPFQIPLGALIPRRVENLIPACKNIGTTHITNGTYRLHPVEWNIGESAGMLIAYCLEKKESPRGVRNTDALLRDFQNRLVAQGVEIHWPKITPR
ncbi:MAG TPA: FAD-dependent oxidoreductase [bacterium]|nr:FAD-dependent oxidoreductase [bacterium]